MKKPVVFFLVVAVIIWSGYSFWPRFSRIPALEAWVLNVGQGESVLVREPEGKKMLFDGGPDDSVLKELGAVLPPWDRTLDLVVLSHPHSDHIRGLITVLERYTVKAVWVSGATYPSADYRAWVTALARHHLNPRHVFAPLQDHLGQVTLAVHHPLRDMTGENPRQAHDATVSVKVSYGTEDIFLTGDLNEEHEQEMVQKCQPPTCSLEAEVLQVPHHGSATGLTPAFLAAVQPKYAAIPVGKDNKFKHPRPSILKELNDAHIPIFRTDLNGRIHLVLTKTTIVEAASQRPP